MSLLSQWLRHAHDARFGILVFGAAALVVILVALALPRRLRAQAPGLADAPPARRRRGLFAGMLLLAVITSCNFFVFFRYPCWVNGWDAFHTTLGSRYLAELQYSALFPCAYRYGRELGVVPQAKWMRDATTLTARPAEELVAEADCDGRFTPERRADFARDLALILDRRECRLDLRMLFMDLGYQNTPFHAFLVDAATDAVGLGPRALEALSFVDALIFLLALIAGVRLFGWRGAMLALLYVSVCFANYFFMADAILRFSHVGLVLGALCAAKAERHRGAAVLLGLASAERLFPVVFAFAYVSKLALDGRHEAASRRALGRFAGAYALTVSIAVALGAVAGGAGSWLELAQKMLVRERYLVALGRGFGARFLVFPDGLPGWSYYIVAGAVVFLAARLLHRRQSLPTFVAVFGLFLLFFGATSLTHYGYVFAAAFLVVDEEPSDRRLIGFQICAVLATIAIYLFGGVVGILRVRSVDLVLPNLLASAALMLGWIVLLGGAVRRQRRV